MVRAKSFSFFKEIVTEARAIPPEMDHNLDHNRKMVQMGIWVAVEGSVQLVCFGYMTTSGDVNF